MSFFLSSLNSPSTLSLSSCIRCSCTSITPVTSDGLSAVCPCLSCTGELRLGPRTPDVFHQWQTEDGNHLLDNIFHHAVQDAVSPSMIKNASCWLMVNFLSTRTIGIFSDGFSIYAAWVSCSLDAGFCTSVVALHQERINNEVPVNQFLQTMGSFWMAAQPSDISAIFYFSIMLVKGGIFYHAHSHHPGHSWSCWIILSLVLIPHH